MALVLTTNAWADEPSVERKQELVNLLKHDCGSCHGLRLRGGLGPSLLPEKLAGKEDRFLVQTILNGRPGTAMPPWRDFISAEEASWLVGYLRRNQ
ncbi:c-type cytochrome [Methylomarinum vadi]|uniref:c-type cytochrome n=1 Tax=Methylomarinum vadi TaxID=438855 RepID=UPI0004DF13FA|nr:cytochrome c [Methylomarinum vadi]